ncbi:hypothetical protein LTR53_006322, partial [Teratosphaeriaceae sp. CCFEE 6253]
MAAIENWSNSKRTVPRKEDQARNALLEWYSAGPDSRMYDLDVLDIWIECAIACIGQSFPLFQTFNVDESTKDELYIAMAAVGGVFCGAEGSFNLARVMYNDARRLALAAPYRLGNLSAEYALSLSKTFVLLEIYGFVSGDKRSFELVDVFHGELLQ